MRQLPVSAAELQPPARRTFNHGGMIRTCVGVLALSICGCAPASSSTSTATATLTFDNKTESVTISKSGLAPADVPMQSTLARATPTRFAMRLVMVYLSEEITPTKHDNVGMVSRIWENPNCSGVADCDYFDFAEGSSAVNAALNSQAMSVQPGTYRYARLEFCRGTPDHPNVEWQVAGMTAPHGWTSGVCVIDSVRFDPPLVIAPGDNVSVSLGYTLDGTTMRADVPTTWTPESHALYDPQGAMLGAFADCVRNADGTSATCLSLPTFTPTASITH